MKRTNDPEVDLLIHGIKATETLMDNMRVIVHDGDVYLGEFDIACCLQHRGPSFRELSDRIRFGWSPPNDLPHLHAPDGVRGTIRAMLLPDHHGLPV